MKKILCVALSVTACAVLLGGCSLFENGNEAANIYIAGDMDIIRPAASSTSTTVPEADYGGLPVRPVSSSSSRTSRPPVNTTTPTPSEPVAPIDNIIGKWYYNHISPKRRAVYARLYNCVKSNGEGIDVSDLGVSEQDVFAAYWAFNYENPQFLTLGSGYELTLLEPRVSNKVKSVKISYGRKPAEVSESEFETRAEAVLAAARAKDTDYEKLKYVHDWLVEHTVYSNTDAVYEGEADGPVVYGKARCEGYAKAFMYFAQSLGFRCICSVGEGRLERHMWNMVQIGGAWYNVDATWDDPVSPDGMQTLRHDYFLINDALFRLDHRVEHPLMLPNAPYGYFPYGYDQDANSSED